MAHGVQFARDSGNSSTSSLTCNLYIRLIGMAVLEALVSMVMVVLRMWYTLAPGLVPMEETSRNLSEVLVWGADAMTTSVRVVLLVEWAGIVVQSALFFGLFALRMDFIHHAIDQVRAVPGFFDGWPRRLRGGGKTDRGIWVDSSG